MFVILTKRRWQDLLANIFNMEKRIMASLDDLKAAVAAETTLVAGVGTLITQLQAKATAVPGLTDDQQAEINSIFAEVTADSASLTSALTAGTPAAPVAPDASGSAPSAA